MKVTVLEIATGRTFTKVFSSIYLGERWIAKLRFSKKLRVIDITTPQGVYGGVV